MLKKIKKSYRKIKAWASYNPPWALSGPAWDSFYREFKREAPIRYWFKHNFRKKYIMPITHRYTRISDWIRYRTYDRYHVVKTGLEPGYYDVQNTVLHVNFNILKEFVEVEQAWQSRCWSDAPQSWYELHIPFYHVLFPFRDSELGVAHFKWAATLDDPALPVHERSEAQARAAREVLELYNWWVNVRPARVAIIPRRTNSVLNDDDIFGSAATDEENDQYYKDLDAMNAQDIEWDDEDEMMLIRFIKIRKSLWT